MSSIEDVVEVNDGTSPTARSSKLLFGKTSEFVRDGAHNADCA
jgi:hypothetical protein